MMRTFYYTATLILLLWGLQSCTNTTFEIKKLQTGTDEDGQAFVGQTLDVEAVMDLTAALTDMTITVTPVSEKGWRFEERFDENLDKGKSVAVEKQLSIPDTASTGKYIITLAATQEDGQSITKQTEVDFAIDSTVPILSPLDVGLNKAGDDLHLETEITAAKKAAKINVRVEGSDWQQSYDFAGAKVAGKLSIHFHEHIHLEEAPAGEYQVTVTVADEEGRTGSISGSFVKK